jgi:hypothetical protein
MTSKGVVMGMAFATVSLVWHGFRFPLRSLDGLLPVRNTERLSNMLYCGTSAMVLTLRRPILADQILPEFGSSFVNAHSMSDKDGR